jgi:hypothetical protein
MLRAIPTALVTSAHRSIISILECEGHLIPRAREMTERCCMQHALAHNPLWTGWRAIDQRRTGPTPSKRSACTVQVLYRVSQRRLSACVPVCASIASSYHTSTSTSLHIVQTSTRTDACC